MLVLTEIVFLVAGIGHCFGFLLKTVMITQGCFHTSEQCLYRAKAFSAFHPPSEEAGGAQRVGEDTAGTADPWAIPDSRVSCSAYRAGGRRERWTIQSDGICFSKSLLDDMQLCCPGVLVQDNFKR